MARPISIAVRIALSRSRSHELYSRGAEGGVEIRIYDNKQELGERREHDENVVEIPLVRIAREGYINGGRQRSEETHNRRLTKSECSTRCLRK